MKRLHWSATVRMRVLDRFDRICQMCRLPIQKDKGFDLDHHIPLSIGGEDEEDNLRPLCRPCHRLKSRGDTTRAAKTKRQEAKNWGAKFRRPWHPTLRRKLNGMVVPR